MEHLKISFASGETFNFLVGNFSRLVPMEQGSEDQFTDDLQVLGCKVIGAKSEWQVGIENALKTQCDNIFMGPIFFSHGP